MRIEVADATGCPVPQFVVHPETKEERMLLKAFEHFLVWGRDEWEFHCHGCTHQNGEIVAFNFGLVTKVRESLQLQEEVREEVNVVKGGQVLARRNINGIPTGASGVVYFEHDGAVGVEFDDYHDDVTWETTEEFLKDCEII